MKLFTIDEMGKFVQFKEQDFKLFNKEIDLETLLEINPEYFFDNNKILHIGRQVTTNLNTFIDLLGIDRHGNTVVVELKRGKTSRETIAQLLEYASFIDNLDYDQLNEIFQNYSNEETDLEGYHKVYFENADDNSISWNKTSKLVIVAQEITNEIKQTSLYLRRKGLDIYCVEFKYFINNENNRMISSDFVIGDENFIKQKINSNSQLPKTNKDNFLQNIDHIGKKIFDKIFSLIEKENLHVRWGAKGFSVNVTNKSEYVGIIFCYPLNCPYNQSIITGFRQIEKKVNEPKNIVNFFITEIKKLELFNTPVGYLGNDELKWNIEKVADIQLDMLIGILEKVIQMTRESLRTPAPNTGCS